MKSRSLRHAVVLLFTLACGAGATPLTAAEVAGLGTGTVVGENVNVRGRATLSSEIVTRVQKGEKVTVLEEVTLAKPKPDEPERWYRIALPSNTPVWVHGDFLDEGKTTKKRLNLRGGPGENYSILGRLEKGTLVKEIRRKEEWVEIERPAEAHAYVAADLVEFIGSFVARANGDPVASAPTPTVSAVTEKAVSPAPAAAVPVAPAPQSAEAKPIETPITLVTTEQVVGVPLNAANNTPKPTEVKLAEPKPQTPAVPAPSIPVPTAQPVTPAPVAPTAAPTAAATPIPAPADPAPGAEKPTRRVVAREGLITGTFFNSIQAPTFFGLRTLQDGRLMNYLHAGKVGLNLESFKGRKVLITGEEFIDKRWPRIPVLEIETIEPSP